MVAVQEFPAGVVDIVTGYGQKAGRAIQIDVNKKAALTEGLLGFDVVANCTPYHFGLIVTGAINVRVSSLDLGGLYNTPSSLL